MSGGMIFFCVYLWLGFAVVTAFASYARGRGIWAWFFHALLFGGFFALLVVLVMKDLSSENALNKKAD